MREYHVIYKNGPERWTYWPFFGPWYAYRRAPVDRETAEADLAHGLRVYPHTDWQLVRVRRT